MDGRGNNFASLMNGKFYGILQWAELDTLWGRVRAAPQGWYATLTGQEPPAVAMSVEELVKFVSEIDILLHREHEHDYCGVVYVDDPENPTLIKIFDPHNMGTGCRVGGAPIPPQWLLSRVRPERISNDTPLTGSRRRWWQNLFGQSA